MEAGVSGAEGFSGRWKEGGIEREGKANPQPKGHQRSQKQSTLIPKWCCQHLVNTKSAGRAVSCLGPESFHQVTDGITQWLFLTTESI